MFPYAGPPAPVLVGHERERKKKQREKDGGKRGKGKKRQQMNVNLHMVSVELAVMNNHIYSTLFKTQERETDRRSKEIEQRN